MTAQEQPVPNGLKLTRNILAAIGATMLLLGLLMEASDGASQIPVWIGMLCLVTAGGFALATTRWKSMPFGAKVVTVIAMAALALVVVDLLN